MKSKLIALLFALPYLAFAQQHGNNGIAMLLLDGGISNYYNPTDTLKLKTKNGVVSQVWITSNSSLNRPDMQQANKDGSEPVFVEYAYEVNALLIDSIAGNKIRVVYGFKNNKYLTAWMDYNPAKYTLISWRNLLMNHSLFFMTGNDSIYYSSPGNFYDDIDGKKQEIPLANADGYYDYIMYPLETQKNWMRVKLVTPSDDCNDPAEPKEYFVWIKYLDKRGHPLVWYYPRGC